jgi:hypothetical protein
VLRVYQIAGNPPVGLSRRSTAGSGVVRLPLPHEERVLSSVQDVVGDDAEVGEDAREIDRRSPRYTGQLLGGNGPQDAVECYGVDFDVAHPGCRVVHQVDLEVYDALAVPFRDPELRVPRRAPEALLVDDEFAGACSARYHRSDRRVFGLSHEKQDPILKRVELLRAVAS